MGNEMTELELTQLIKKLNFEALPTSSRHELFHGNGKPADCTKDGWIEVKNQTIDVHDPEEGGNEAVIRAASPLEVKVNGQVIESECQVSSKDTIEWRIQEEPLFEIHVSSDKLSAYFHLKSKERYAWRLVDTEPLQRNAISADENKEIVLETLHVLDVVNEIEKRSITKHVDLFSIQQEMTTPTHQPILIARGKPPTPGKDARLELYFSEQVENQFFEVSGYVDFRNHLQIPTVSSGEVIARKIPLIEGIPGYDVYGNVIIPEPAKDVIVVTKPSVEMTPAGEIIALKDGRPRMTGGKMKTIDISTSYIVPGNVDIETGNIVFSGDVIVYGNVTDNMIIESLGNIYVYGSVYHATLTATGSIYIRGNVIGSKLYSGYFGVLFNRLYHASKLLDESIDQLLTAANTLAQALESKRQKVRYGQILLLLIENKFKNIPSVLKDLMIVISNIQHIKKEEYHKLKELCAVFLQPPKLLEIATPSFVQSFLSLLQETHQEVNRMQEEKSEIRVNQCHKSVMKSNGDIVIQREGVISSDLYAAGNIIFSHRQSVCRGSQLEAGGSIYAMTIGGETGVGNVLKARRQIKVRRMFSGRICIDKYCTEIYEEVVDNTFTVQSIRRKIMA